MNVMYTDLACPVDPVAARNYCFRKSFDTVAAAYRGVSKTAANNDRYGWIAPFIRDTVALTRYKKATGSKNPATDALKEMEENVYQIRAEGTYKNAAARWATELLKRSTPALANLAGLKPAQRVAHTPINRHALLRTIRGDFDGNFIQSLANSGKLDTARRTLKMKELGTPVPAVEIPIDPMRTAFRGLRKSTEFIENGKIQSGTGQTRTQGIFYAAHPETAAQYARTADPPRSVLPTPAAQTVNGIKSPQLVVQTNIEDIAAHNAIPPLSEQLENMSAGLQGKAPHQTHPMWHRVTNKAQGEKFIDEGRSASEKIVTRGDVIHGREIPYEGTGATIDATGKPITPPVQKTWIVEPELADRSKLSPAGQKRYDDARAIEEARRDQISPGAILTPVELLESERMPAIRTQSFLKRFS